MGDISDRKADHVRLAMASGPDGSDAGFAEQRGLAMGVGTQRAALVDSSLRDTYAVARREAPTAFLMANVGASQLVAQGSQPPLSTDDVRAPVDMIEADALVVHLNPLQELIGPEIRSWLAAVDPAESARSV